MNKFAIGCGGLVILLLFVALIAGLWLRGRFNTLVTLQTDVDAKWADVQTQYQRRYDLIPNLVSTVQGAANFEKSTLTEVTNARASVGRVQMDASKAPTDAAQLAQFQQAQGQLGNALSRLLVVSENYPDLKATRNFQELQIQIEGTENRINNSRRNYNESVQTFNVAIRQFPTNLFIGLFHMQPRIFFNAQTEAAKAPTVNFNFGTPAPSPAASASP